MERIKKMPGFVCEICGNQDIVKKDGFFVCNNCGTKYSTEEARKLLLESADANDHSANLENLFKAARNAREIGDDDSAIAHYKKIQAIAPDNWESLFYLVILKTNKIKLGEIQPCAISVTNCLPKVFELINETLDSADDKKEAIWQVIQQCQNTAEFLTSASQELYGSLSNGNKLIAITGISGAIMGANSQITERNEDCERCVSVANIMFICGNCICETFDMSVPDYASLAVWSWKNALGFHKNYQEAHRGQDLFDKDSIRRLEEYINKYASEEEALVTLTVEFDSKALSVARVLYRIDDGPKNGLNRKRKASHTLEKGFHTIKIVNPFMKKVCYTKAHSTHVGYLNKVSASGSNEFAELILPFINGVI